MHAEDSVHVVEIAIDVKSWTKSVPSVRALRPSHCPRCGAPGVESSGKVVLHGHGVRRRSCWGPGDPEEPSGVECFVQRRYACRRCRAVVVVRPRGILRGKRYRAAAIAFALWLWAGELSTDADVRRRVGIQPEAGVSRPERWTTLRRWAKAARLGQLWRKIAGPGQGTVRHSAQYVARVIAGLATPDVADPRARIFAGVALVR